MTTYFRQDVTCANCRQASEQQVLGSTNAFGSCDLDLRPPEMKRSTMRAWLQHCPHCGYVAPNLAGKVGDLAVVSGSDYRHAISDRRYPELARKFLAHALLYGDSDPTSAGQARLSAAWVCDDTRQLDLANQCRELAAEDFARLKPFADSEPGVTLGAIFVDVLRRAGLFEAAAAECQTLLALPHAAGILRQVLEFQARLIAARDATGHRVEECTG